MKWIKDLLQLSEKRKERKGDDYWNYKEHISNRRQVEVSTAESTISPSEGSLL